MDKTILITGATGGIGSQVAIQAWAKGYEYHIVGRNIHKTQYAKYDAVIHCAGCVKPLPCKWVDMENIDITFEANFIFPVILTSKLLQEDRLNPGASVIFISSESVNSPYPGGAMLAASKAALEAYARNLQMEQKQLKVHVIRPGMVATKMTNFVGEPPENIAKQIIDLI